MALPDRISRNLSSEDSAKDSIFLDQLQMNASTDLSQTLLFPCMRSQLLATLDDNDEDIES